MKPEKGTRGDKAYTQGIKAAKNKLDKNCNPYILSKYIHLSNWWLKGYKEESNKLGCKNA